MRPSFLAGTLLAVLCGTLRAGDSELASYAAHLGAAEATFRLGEIASTRKWLDAAPPQHRGFEWSVLDARLDESARTLVLSDVAIWGLDVSADGSKVSIGDASGRVKVLDLKSGAELFVAHEHKDLVDDVRFDATGERLVSASHDRTVRIWDLKTKACARVFEGHRFAVGGAAFLPDGASVISAGYERNWNGKSVAGVVHRWSVSDGSIETTYEGGGNKPLSSLAIAKNGARFAVGSWDFCAFGWDIGESGEARQYITPDEGLYNAVDCVAFSPDGTRIAHGGKNHLAHVFDAETTALELTLRGHGDNVTGIAFSPDGSRIATSCVDSVVRLFDASTGERIAEMRGATPSSTGLVFTPDGASLLVSTSDGRVLVFDVSHTHYGEIRRDLPVAAYSVRFSPDGTILASCTHDGRIQLYTTTDFDRFADWQAHEASKCAIALEFTPSGEELLSCSYDGTIRRWSVETQEEIGRNEFGAGVYAFALSPDGDHIAAALMNKEIAIAHRESGEITTRFKDAAAVVYSLRFDSSGSRLVAGGADRRARVYELATSQLVCTTDATPGAILTVLFARDERTFLTGGDDGVVREWNATTGANERTVFTATHAVNRLAFTRDGSRLVGAGQHLWFLEPKTGHLLATLRVTREASWDLEFSPDGTRLATADLDDAIRVLDAIPLRAR